MRVIIVNQTSPGSRSVHNRIGAFMTKALRKHFAEAIEVSIAEPLFNDENADEVFSALQVVGDNFNSFLTENTIHADFILCVGGNAVIPFYSHTIPIAYWHNSTWSTVKNNAFTKFSNQKNPFFLWDKLALEKSAVIAFSSEEVKNSCIDSYNINSEKVHVIPYGAHIDEPHSGIEIERCIQERKHHSINLTFLGSEYNEEGLDLAFNVARELHNSGKPVRLTILGCTPLDEEIFNSPITRVYGELDYNNHLDNKLFHGVLCESHFLIHAVQSSPVCTTLATAGAFGVPVIALHHKGYQTIRENVNGFTYPYADFVKGTVANVIHIMENYEVRYKSLARSSFLEYKNRLNWDTNALALKELLISYSFNLSDKLCKSTV
jgi:glycosyltransferase involved in cell wall biosynthesis